MKQVIKTFLCIVVAVFIVLPSQSHALTREQRFEIERRFWYDETDCTNPSSSSGTGVFTGSNNAEITFNYFVSKGMSGEQAAGIVGNLQAESSIDPKSVQQGGDGRGIAQWDKDDRWINLQNFARGNNLDFLLLETQLQFIWFELTGEPPTQGATGASESAAYDDFKVQTTVEGATTSFLRKYERAGVERLEERIAFAKEALGSFAGAAVGGLGSTGSTDPCVGAAAGAAVGGIAVFPQKINKTKLKEGVDGAKWCYQATENCHHDYNAADIHAPIGTENIAAQGGTVVAVTDAIGGVGSRVTIKGADGKFIYYYAHMAYGSLQVQKDQEVTTGQVIGKVGDSVQAVGTPPHLHFDMLPADQFDFRVSCSGSDCSGYPFVDVQPILVQFFERLQE